MVNAKIITQRDRVSVNVVILSIETKCVLVDPVGSVDVD